MKTAWYLHQLIDKIEFRIYIQLVYWHTIIKIKSKWVKELDVKAQTINFPEENKGENPGWP